jgi:hypothetical protein
MPLIPRPIVDKRRDHHTAPPLDHFQARVQSLSADIGKLKAQHWSSETREDVEDVLVEARGLRATVRGLISQAAIRGVDHRTAMKLNQHLSALDTLIQRGGGG